MYNNKRKLIKILITGSMGIAYYAHAEIDLIKTDQLKSQLLAPLNIQLGGQFRPEWIFSSSNSQIFQRQLHDGASRLRYSMNYKLSNTSKLLSYYELGINVPKVFDWEDHYAPGAKSFTQRQAYIGIENDDFGTLTYGQQYGLQYTVIGSKSDLWDNDGLNNPSSIGINGSYDGNGNFAKKNLMYKKSIGPHQLYANILFPVKEIPTQLNQSNYQRQYGFGLGVDAHLNTITTLSAAYSSTAAKINNAKQHQQLQQNILGTAISLTPRQWTLVATASYYHDYVPFLHPYSIDQYFAGDGYGLEGFAGYSFKFDRPYFSELQPYIAADTLQLKANQRQYSHHQFIGLATQLSTHIRLATEYTFVQATDKSLKNAAYITMYLNF